MTKKTSIIPPPVLAEEAYEVMQLIEKCQAYN